MIRFFRILGECGQIIAEKILVVDIDIVKRVKGGGRQGGTEYYGEVAGRLKKLKIVLRGRPRVIEGGAEEHADEETASGYRLKTRPRFYTDTRLQ